MQLEVARTTAATASVWRISLTALLNSNCAVDIHGLRLPSVNGLNVVSPSVKSVGELLLSLHAALFIAIYDGLAVRQLRCCGLVTDPVSFLCEFAVRQLLLIERDDEFANMRPCVPGERNVLLEDSGLLRVGG